MKNRHSPQTAGFTLVELLIVVTILGILAALLFPAFAPARDKARGTSCSSNLRQMGLAIQEYVGDYDGHMPAAVDPSDKMLPQNYAAYPQFQAMIPALPNIKDVLQPYTRHEELWHCPSDSGFDTYEATMQPLDGRPTSFAALGTSYLLRTQLTYDYQHPTNFTPRLLSSLSRPAETDVLYDAWGWHGPPEPACSRRFNVLCADGHVKNLDRGALSQMQHQPL